ncbi:hypothetical protein SLA2020_141850 [Shorea laevis]
MELLKLSKFKLQLRALVTESRDLRERERSATEQIRLLIQKQKQTEEEYSRKLQELQAEVASCNESREKLQRKVSYLQNDNALLENKQKELKGTINGLLQSRDDFIKSYQESTCKMKCSIEARDRKLTVLAEKINSHLSLFDSIEKEASSVKHVVDEVQRIVSEKEELVVCLKTKMDQVSSFEKVFVEKINNLENKLKSNEAECQRKDKTVSDLEAQLEKTVLAKDAVIQNLISEKEALHFQARNLAAILQKIQNAVTRMDKEDRRVFSSVLAHHDECDKIEATKDKRIQDMVQNGTDISPFKSPRMDSAENRALPLRQEYNAGDNPLEENKNINSCGYGSESAYSELQSAANIPNISVDNDEKDDRELSILQLHSECSTTQAQASEDPGVEA